MKFPLILIAIAMLMVGCGGGSDDPEPAVWDEFNWDSDHEWQ